jgi:hypothetical protein
MEGNRSGPSRIGNPSQPTSKSNEAENETDRKKAQ